MESERARPFFVIVYANVRRYVAALAALVAVASLANCRGEGGQNSVVLCYPSGSSYVRHDLSSRRSQVLLELDLTHGSRHVSRYDTAASANCKAIAYFESTRLGPAAVPQDTYLCVLTLPARTFLLRSRVANTYVRGSTKLSVSPDSSRLAVLRMGGVASPGELSVFDLALGKPVISKTPTYGMCVGVSWHPNNHRLAYEDRWGRPVIRDLSRRSTKVVGKKGEPCFSPDGTRLAVANGGAVSIQVGGRVSSVITIPERATFVGWSEDGSELLYASPTSLFEAPSTFGYSHRIYARKVGADSTRKLPAVVLDRPEVCR